jgi:hypothetical protein
MVEAILVFRVENWIANFSMDVPTLLQYAAALEKNSLCSGVAGCQSGAPLVVRSPDEKGDAFIMPIPFSEASGRKFSSLVSFRQ